MRALVLSTSIDESVATITRSINHLTHNNSDTIIAWQTFLYFGFTQPRLDLLTHFIKNNLGTTGMLIIKDGKILYQYADIEEVGYLASCRKSILSILYGKYVENGTIDLKQTIGEMGIDEDKGLLKIEKTATIDNIITARSGAFYEPANGGCDKDNMITFWKEVQ